MGETDRKKLRWLFAIALPLMSLALFVLVFELGVLLLIGEQPKFPRHVVGAEFGVRVNQPNATYRHKSADGTWWFTINSKGLRADREYDYDKPPGVRRIVSLGDSFTAGYEVQGDEVFSSVLERELQEAGLRVEVLNAGVSGYSNAEALVYLERELLRYDPDIIMLSFFANDLVDNVRSGLFAVSGGELVQVADEYVPAGALGNFLNTNPIFNWLSGYLNSFVYIKEQLTHLVKRQIVSKNLETVAEATEALPSDTEATTDSGGAPPGTADDLPTAEQALAVAILDRLYEVAHARGIPLIIQSIPILVRDERDELIETFPLDHFERDREGLYFLGMQRRLSPYLGEQGLGDTKLYNERSHWHWTAFSHEVSGKALAEIILEEDLLRTPSTGMSPGPSPPGSP